MEDTFVANDAPPFAFEAGPPATLEVATAVDVCLAAVVCVEAEAVTVVVAACAPAPPAVVVTVAAAPPAIVLVTVAVETAAVVLAVAVEVAVTPAWTGGAAVVVAEETVVLEPDTAEAD